MRAQRRRRDLRAAARDIGHQPLAPHHHRRLRHRAVLQQRRLDLAGLDAQSPQLHLAVRAPEELHHPVAPPAPEIPRPVEPPAAGAERVRHEPLRREPRPPDISPRQADAAEIDLPGHPHRHRRQTLVQDVDPHVRDRPAQRRRHRAPAGAPSSRRPSPRSGRRHYQLRPEPGAARRPAPPGRPRRRTTTSGTRPALLRARLPEQLRQQRGDELQHGDVVLDQGAGEIAGIAVASGRAITSVAPRSASTANSQTERRRRARRFAAAGRRGGPRSRGYAPAPD